MGQADCGEEFVLQNRACKQEGTIDSHGFLFYPITISDWSENLSNLGGVHSIKRMNK